MTSPALTPNASLGTGWRPAAPRGSFGAYVHFPYCLAKCPYCDFLSIPSERAGIPHVAYADAVLAELERRAFQVEGLELHSVFFGGGTPSLWDPRELGRVLSALLNRFPAVANGPEITVECNPGSFDAGVAAGLRAAGVNRISLGVQSLNAERLKFLGRHHDAAEALEALDLATRSGFGNVSGDLIFGVAGQSAQEAADEVARVIDAGVTHVSAYALTIEPGTQFGELARRGRLPLLHDDAVADAFAAVRTTLESRDFVHYEISNYARPSREARHNLGYWRGEPYLGLGVGAWGTVTGHSHKLRYRNTPAIERYLRGATDLARIALDREGPLVATLETITPEVDAQERLLLGLRLAEGVDVQELEALTGSPFWTPSRRRNALKWSARGALIHTGSRLRLAPTHWLVADAVIRDLL